MTQRQPELPEIDGEGFDRWLMEALPENLREFIAELPQALSDRSLDFLHDFKRRVDARLAAEPHNRFFSMSDPHEIRVHCWTKIAERFQAEIDLRSGKSASAVRGESEVRGEDPEVAKRRSIVRKNRTKSSQELCRLFDFDRVLLPRDWQGEFPVKSWDEAYRNEGLRHRIHSLINRDKNATDES
jgi:hypothetical protein